MKLLFDNNLSHKLVNRLTDIFPDSSHVMDLNLDESEDSFIWKVVKENSFIIVTKDADFNEFSLLKGYPPKVIWLRTGNCSITDIEALFRKNIIIIKEFENNNRGLLEIS
jgi:predicted nuclease of predicted toxin-antitoxin system